MDRSVTATAVVDRPGQSYTGAVLLAADVAPPPWQIIVKVVPDGAPGREADALTEALDAVPEFSRGHLAGHAFPPLRLEDGRTVMFQEIAGDSLRDTIPPGSLDREETDRVAEQVVRGLLAEWNGPGLEHAVPEEVTVSAFLRRELDDVWTGRGLPARVRPEPGVSSTRRRRGCTPTAAGCPIRTLVEGISPPCRTPPCAVLRGMGHGDLHLDNILVPRKEKVVQADDYRLIDLCTFNRKTDLGRDAATLLLSALVPHVRHEQPPDQRKALLRFIVDPDARHRARIVPEAGGRWRPCAPPRARP